MTRRSGCEGAGGADSAQARVQVGVICVGDGREVEEGLKGVGRRSGRPARRQRERRGNRDVAPSRVGLAEGAEEGAEE